VAQVLNLAGIADTCGCLVLFFAKGGNPKYSRTEKQTNLRTQHCGPPLQKTQGWGTPGFLNSNVIKSPGTRPPMDSSRMSDVRRVNMGWATFIEGGTALARRLRGICRPIFLQ